MQIVTFVPHTDRIRRRAAWFGLALLALTAAVTLAVVAGDTIRTVIAATILAGIASLALWGTSVLYRRGARIEIDLANRSFRSVEGGVAHAWRALSDFGPIEIEFRSRTVKSKNGNRTIIEYAVIGRGRRDLDLYVENNPHRARRLMEALARAWQLPCRSLGGELRMPEDLDRPLHERCAGDSSARRPRPLRPEWRVTVESQDDRTTLSTSHRDLKRTLGGPVLVVAPALVTVLVIAFGGMRQLGFGGMTDPVDFVFAGALATVILVLLARLAVMTRDALFPGSIEVTQAGVRHRGRFVALDEIEEVVSNGAIEVVSDRKTIELPLYWCPAPAIDDVAHELRRAIIEAGTSRPTRTSTPSDAPFQLSGTA